MYQLVFYVPENFCEEVKAAVFAKDAGQYKNYSHCCWQATGTGQFRPISGSNPFIGHQGKIEKVSEIKVEMIVQDKFIQEVITALKAAHPYEEPAYSVFKLEDY